MVSKKLFFLSAIAGIFACFVLAIASMGAANPFQGALWAGVESSGAYLGGEFVFLPYQVLGIESAFDVQVYGQIAVSQTFGLRGVFPQASLGTGLGFNAYEGQSYFCPKGYFWASFYGPSYFAKAYFDATPGFNCGKISLMVDDRSPLGFELSYLDSVTSAGEYEELRGNLSASLLYPYRACWKTKYDCDLRIYLGYKAVYFLSQARELYAWSGTIGGIRIIVPQGDFRFGVRVPDNFPQKKGEIAVSASVQF